MVRRAHYHPGDLHRRRPGVDGTTSPRPCRRLTVPPSVLERLRQALATATHRAFQQDGTRSIRVTVSTRVTQPQAARASAGWGFFIVERAAGDGEHQHIEVFLYPDGS